MNELKINIVIFFVLILTTLATSIFILNYCDIFYDLGMVAKERFLQNQLLAFFTPPFLFWVSAYLCRKYAINASGSNLSHVKSVLYLLKKNPNSFEKISPFLSLRIVVVNSISSLIATFGGGALGREGPSVQMSSSIFVVVANKLRRFFPQINLETWIFAGSGVGVAIAFNAPAAGFFYVIERLFRYKSKNFRQNLNWTFATMLVLTLILLQMPPLFQIAAVKYEGAEIFLAVLAAITCGIVAYFFMKISNYFYLKIVNIKSNKWHLFPIIAGFAVSGISLYGGIYSFGGGMHTLADVLASNEIILSYKEVFGRVLNTILTFVAGCAGGLVAPSVAIGSGIGSIFATIFATANIKFFILSGMAAFLGSVIAMPISAAILVIEMTNQSIIMLPIILLFSLISFLTTKAFEKIKFNGKFF
jgi:H+/Cl- antiporter ClcA